MNGTIKRFANAMHLLPKKRSKKAGKKKSTRNTVFRDYRGSRGAIKDAEGK